MKPRVIIIKKTYAFVVFAIISMMMVFLPSVIYMLSKPVNIIVPLSGSRLVVIDPGHGGIDGGVSKEKIVEKEINLDISKKLRKILEDRGYSVIMTRDEDISLGGTGKNMKNRHSRDLNKRVEIINNSKASIFVSIHVNSNVKKPKTNGSIVFFSSKFNESEVLAYNIQRSLNSIIIDGKSRSIHDPRKAGYFILKNAEVPGVLVESAFITNEKEKKLLSDDSFHSTIAESIADGIDNYFKVANQNFGKKG